MVMASTLEELESRSGVDETQFKGKKLKLVLESLDKMAKKASQQENLGDLETAFILYSRFLQIFNYCRNNNCEFQKDEKYAYGMMGGKSKIKEIFDKRAALYTKLQKRYQAKAQKEAALIEAAKLKEMERRRLDSEKEFTNKDSNNAAGGKKVVKEKDSITSMELKSLMDKKSTSFLLIDIRPSKDFKLSSIKHSNSISIPEECLIKGGFTADSLKHKIPVQYRDQWNRRASFDKLIVIDWTSESVENGSPLEHLRDALSKWSNPQLHSEFLHGGFQMFAMACTMLVSDSSKSRAPSAKSARNSVNLNKIEYPNLDEAFVRAPSPRPRSSNGVPSPAIASGAITINPVMPSRANKPPIENNNNNNSELNNARFIDSSTASTKELRNHPSIPDRSLKAKLLINKDDDGEDDGEIDGVLEAEKEIVEESLEGERKILKLENKWEQIRQERERAAEDELRKHLQDKEDKLIQEIEELTLKNKNQEEESENLKRELKEMKKKLKSKVTFQIDNELEKEKEAKIKEKELEQRRLQEEVQEKRRLRKEYERRKLEENRLEKEKSRLEHEKRVADAEAKRRQVEAEVAEAERRKNNELIRKAKLNDEPRSGGSGGLNRSYSSPNINQDLKDEEVLQFNHKNYLPALNFDRSKKPTSSDGKIRNFEQVWASSGKKGLTGLKNLGNTCYMNSVLQCISNFTNMARYFMSDNYIRDINSSSETRGDIAKEYSALLTQLWNGNAKSISPNDMKKVIGRYNSNFRGYDQQDAHELLMRLMEWLHNDVNEIKTKVHLKELNLDNMDDKTAANESWRIDLTADKSFIRTTFYGQRKSTLMCKTCRKKSVMYEPFIELSLELPPGNGRVSLHECIRMYLEPVDVEWKCPQCKRIRDSCKKFDIVKFPSILTIHIARFYNDGLWRKKQNFVDFEKCDMNLGQYASVVNGDLNRYQHFNLYSVCNHFGTMEGGHYTAYSFSQLYNKWYKYDDHEVSEIDRKNVATPAAYILFYSALK